MKKTTAAVVTTASIRRKSSKAKIIWSMPCNWSAMLKKNSKSKDKYITELEKINQEITDYSNPVIIKYKLKS